MPPADCLPQVHACLIRVGLLDTDGSPLAGADNLYTSNALTKLTLTPEYRDGTEIEEPNGCDEVCVAYKPAGSLKWATAEIELCTPDPYLEAFLGGGTTIAGMDPDDPSGGAAPAIGPVARRPIAIEVWAKRIFANDLDPDFPFAWWAYPKLINMRPGVRTHEVASKKPTFTGLALENDNYGDGVGGDWPASSDRYEQWVPWATMPSAVCGPTAIPAS